MGYAAHKGRYASNSVDALLSRVLRLPTLDLWHFFDKLVGRPEVIASGWRVSERRISPRPNEERDAKMTRLHNSGLSYADIARACNLKPATVARAIQRFRRRQRDSDSLSPPSFSYAG